jgi:excinuclease UvrABC nuclease subunit
VLAAKAMAEISATPAMVLNPHGFNVYLLCEDSGRPIYVGQSANILSRLGTHLSQVEKRSRVTSVQVINCDTRQAMDDLELALIKIYQPSLNVRGK